jgi:hypothetical protein
MNYSHLPEEDREKHDLGNGPVRNFFLIVSITILTVGLLLWLLSPPGAP